MSTITAPSPLPTRKLQVAPNVFRTLPRTRNPKTRLGAVAQNLTEQATLSSLSIAVTSGYVYALTGTGLPSLTFNTLPPGMGTSTVQQLQNAWDQFCSQFNIFQGEAGAFIHTNTITYAPSILAQLTALPELLNLANSSVQSYFLALQSNPQGSPAYNSALSLLQTQLKDQVSAVGALNTALTQLGSQLSNIASTLETDATTGILYQLQQAYQADITTIQNAINQANSTISSDNSKIAGEGVGAGVSVAVGVVGLLNWWNPIGWIMMGAGAVGAYFSIEEIEALKSQVASLKAQINTDETYQNQDTTAAAMVQTLSISLQGFESLNQGAQAELTALENLLTTLSDDIGDSLSDADANEITQAIAEWNAAISECGVLSGITAYVWPTPTEVSSTSTYAAVGSDIYALATSGEMYHYSGGSNTWTDMNVTALSIAGAGNLIAAIDGAPIDGTSESPTSPSTFFVKTYNISGGTWSTISSWPACAIATDGKVIAAVSQVTTSRQVQIYNTSNGTWTACAALPNTDAANQVAVVQGTVYALSTNYMKVYAYNASNSTWTAVPGLGTCASIQGNGSWLSILDTNGATWSYNGSGNPTSMSTGMMMVSTLPSGNQLTLDTSSNVWSIIVGGSSTNIEPNATMVLASDTGNAYCGTFTGTMYSINLSTNVLTPIAGLPTS